MAERIDGSIDLPANPEQEHRPRVFFGAAMQGHVNRAERADLYRDLMAHIESLGFEVVFDHTRGKSREEVQKILEARYGNIPPDGSKERKEFVRSRIIEEIEGDIVAAIFEVSTPSLGTGIEIAHAYSRPRMRRIRQGTEEPIPAIPILLLFQEGYWANGLSTMVAGIPQDEFPDVEQGTYQTLDEAKQKIADFLQPLLPKAS